MAGMERNCSEIGGDCYCMDGVINVAKVKEEIVECLELYGDNDRVKEC